MASMLHIENNQSIKQLGANTVLYNQQIVADTPDFNQSPQSSKNIHIKKINPPHELKKIQTIGFEQAQWEQALKKTKSMSVLHIKDQNIPYITNLDHFRVYGSGYYLFFTFAKKVIFLFLILILISIIPVVYNALIGQRYTSIKDSLSKYLSVLTIGNLRPYDQKNSSLTDKLVNALPTFFVSVILFSFYGFWNRKSQQQEKLGRSYIKSNSYKTVQVIKFPKDITQPQLLSYMSRFGQVKQISTVRNYNETIFYSRKIYDLTLNTKELILQRQKKQIQTDQKFQKYIQKRKKQIKKLQQKLQLQENEASKEILKFFVTFQSSQDRQKVVETFLPYFKSRYSCCKQQYPSELKYKGEKVLVKACHIEPAGIIWENVHVTWKTRWLRLLLQLLLIIIVIFLGFCFILILNALNPPITTSRVDSSAYNQTTIVEVTDKPIVRSWCLNNNDLVYQNPDSDYGRLCQQYLASTVSRVFISILIAFGIMIIKYVLKYIVLYLSKFMRYKTHTQEATEITKNLFLTYFFSTVFITIFMQAKFDSFSPKELVKYISSSEEIQMNLREMNEFNDLTQGWYLDVGYQIWVTWFILAISYPLLILTYHYPLQMLCKYLAKKQVLQRKMQKYLMPQQFQISDHYANIMLFIFVGIVFSPGMPSLLILTGIGLIFRYFYFKFVFIRFSRIPKPIDESLNSILLKVIVIAIFSHLIIAIWMYGVDSIFGHQDSFLDHELYNQNSSKFQRFWLIVLKRGIDSLYLSFLLIIYLIYFFLGGFLCEIKNQCTRKNEDQKASPQILTENVNNGGIKSQVSLTNSYKIENNPDYFDILVTMQLRQPSSPIRLKINT